MKITNCKFGLWLTCVLVGLLFAGSVQAVEALNWPGAGGVGNITTPRVNTVGNITVTTSVARSSPAATTSSVTAIANGLQFDMDADVTGRYIDVTFSFSRPVTGLAFSILGINGGTGWAWNDRVILNPSGGQTPTTTSVGSLVTWTAATRTAQAIANSGTNSADTNIAFRFTQALSTVTVRYFAAPANVANPVAQSITLGNLSWDSGVVRVRKTTTGGVGGPFAFTQTNLFTTPASITTTLAGSPTPASPVATDIDAPGSNVTLAETAQAGWTLTGVSCIDANRAATGNPSTSLGTLSGSTVTLSASSLVLSGSDITCTFTNNATPSLSIAKTSNGPWTVGQVGATYTLNLSNVGSLATSGTITVRDQLPAGIGIRPASGFTAATGWTCSYSDELAQGTHLVNPSTGMLITCTSTTSIPAGGAVALTLPVVVTSASPASVINYASAGGGGDPFNAGTAPIAGPACTDAAHCSSATTNVTPSPPSPAICPTGTAVNLLQAPLLGSFTANNTTQTSTAALIATAGSYAVGTGAGGRFVVDMNWRWGAGMPLPSTASTLTLRVNGIDYATLTTQDGVPGFGTLTASNGASLFGGTTTVETNRLSLENVWVTLPSSVSTIASVQMFFTGGAVPGDDFENVSATAVYGCLGTADLSVTKTDGNATYTPGTNVVYTITATNLGPSGASNVTVSDPLPAGITTASWTCAATSGGAVCGASGGVGAINDTGLNLPAGAEATYTLTLAVPAAFTGNLVNTVTVSPSAGTTDPVPGNNTATDTNTQAVPTFNFCAANTIYNHDQTGSGATFAQRTHRFDIATATESTINDLLLSLPGALDVNALMIDPVTNRLITTVHTGPGPSQLWAYDAANGGWYAASPTFTGLVPRGGMNASGVGYLIGNGSTPPVWRVQASGPFTYSVTPIGALSYNVPPTDLVSGDLAFDGNGIGWLAVGRDLWTIDFSVAPLQAVRQQRPTLNGSPLAFNLSGIAFGTDGDLYVANSGNPSPASGYYRVDLNAGTITLSSSASNVRDLASCAFPVQVPPELQVAKTLATVNGAPYVAGNSVGAGDTLGYTITIAHVGGNVAATLYAGDVVETLPANTTYVATGNDFNCTGSNCPSIADIGVPVGGSVTLNFIVQVNALLPSGATSIDNAVAVNGEAAVDCAAPGNDCEESTPLSVVADLWITKTNTPAEGPVDGNDDVVLSGSTTTYQITVGNNGPVTLVGAILTDVTENLSSCVLAAPACVVASGVATCPAVGSGAGELSVPNLFGAGVSIPVLQGGGSLIVRMTCTVD